MIYINKYKTAFNTELHSQASNRDKVHLENPRIVHVIIGRWPREVSFLISQLFQLRDDKIC